MGNWRTINIIGTMSEEHAAALRDLLDYTGDNWDKWDNPYSCLLFDSRRPGLAGLGVWPAAEMNCAGNLAERGYGVEDVAKALRALLPTAPTMLLKVHCGGEWESGECVATVSVGEGLVVVGKPEVAKVTGPSEMQMMGNLFQNLLQ